MKFFLPLLKWTFSSPERVITAHILDARSGYSRQPWTAGRELPRHAPQLLRGDIAGPLYARDGSIVGFAISNANLARLADAASRSSRSARSQARI